MFHQINLTGPGPRLPVQVEQQKLEQSGAFDPLSWCAPQQFD